MKFQGSGLTNQEVKLRQDQYGPNLLPQAPRPSELAVFFQQLKSPLVYILIVAGIITFFLEQYEDTTIILIAVLLNTILGYYQESKAGKALEALKQMLQDTTTVLRSGAQLEISTDQLVPGDIVLLKSGDKLPADGKIKRSNRLFVMEAMLTGESVPIAKQEDNTAWMGTVVTSGEGVMEVELIGAQTEMGKIATSVQHKPEHTPLQKQLAYFSKQLSIIVLIITIIVFAFGLLTGKDPVDIFTTSVALAVGAIPEGLLVALTVVLALGMQKILKRKGLVKNLLSAETLGGVTTICTDKTGTLTMGEMSVVELIGDKSQIAHQAAIANDRDNAVAIATGKRADEQLSDQTPPPPSVQIDSIPFSSENKFFASLHDHDQTHNTVYMTGAPDYVIERTDSNDTTKQLLRQQIYQFTSIGYRLIGYASKLVPSSTTSLEQIDLTSGFSWHGLLCLSDPVREDVKDALQKTHQAGIKLIVITGDYPQTAKYIMKQLGVEVTDQSIILGDQLAAMSHTQLDERLEHDSKVKLFARTKPEQKMRIVTALKQDGEVVAMMGDGVNDAPAIKKSDIGIVVGEATDVAKESADLVLLDSSFATIVAAIEEGRTIFDNIRKIILYLMSDAFVQIIAIMFAMIMGVPLPISASQILWINLVSDGFPNLAMTVDPKRKGIMSLPPRSPKEPLIASRMLKLIAIVSISGGIATFALYSYILHQTGDLDLARSTAFVSFGMTTMLYVYSVRSLRRPVWQESFFDNKRLILGILAGTLLVVSPFLIPILGRFLQITPIGYRRFPAVGTGVLIVVIIEFFKYLLREEQAATS